MRITGTKAWEEIERGIDELADSALLAAGWTAQQIRRASALDQQQVDALREYLARREAAA